MQGRNIQAFYHLVHLKWECIFLILTWISYAFFHSIYFKKTSSLLLRHL